MSQNKKTPRPVSFRKQLVARKKARLEASAELSASPPPQPAVETVESEPSYKNAPFVWRYKRSVDTTTSPTHTSIIGGSFVVPLEMRKAFRAEYFAEFLRLLANPAANPSLFLTERYNGEYFRFFIDVDYSWDASPPDVLATIRHIQNAVAGIVSYVDGDALHDIEVRPSERTPFKRHFVFPQVIMSSNCLLFAQAVEKLLHLRCDLDIEFDMKVYQRGSLRLLGSCKDTGLTPSHVNETEFFYMPIDPKTGERCKTITLEEFSRHSILLDSDAHERVKGFMASDAGVYLPRDEQFADDLFVTSKYVCSGEPAAQSSSVTYAPQYTGPPYVKKDSALFNLIGEKYGEKTAKDANNIVEWNNSLIVNMQSKFCTFIGRDHTKNHMFIQLSERGMQLKCHSTNDARCIKGGKLVLFADLPAEVAESIPTTPDIAPGQGASIQANADLTTIRGQAELFHADFIADDLVPDDDEHNLAILSLSGTHRDVANLVHPMLGNEYVCVDADNQRWYHYREPLWRFKEAKNDVKVMISTLPNTYASYIQIYYKNFSGKEEIRKQRIGTIKHVNDKVSDHQFKDKVAKELASMSEDVRFESTLDVDSKLIGFNDGIFDLSTFKFERGTPEHRVSMTVGYDFPKESNPKYRQELEKLMEDIQPEEENREYLQTFLGGLLEGGNPDELFHIFAGTGRNGKGVEADLISVALGAEGYDKEGGELSKFPYVYAFEPAFLTCDRTTSSTPAPEIVRARLSRVLIGSEPEPGQKINSAFIKKLSGNDPLSGRLLFSNEIISFRPRFKIVLQCNGIPVMNHNDQAVWKRARIIDFPTTFVDNPEKPNERQIDRKLKGRILADMNYRKEFMLMLIHWYKTLYLVKGLHNPPASVLKATQLYQDESVPVAEYWRECITTVAPSAHKHLCVQCILDDFCRRHPDKVSYTPEKLRADLNSIGVVVNKAQTRCSNCPRKKYGVKNCQFSEERKKERNEVMETSMAVPEVI